MSRKKLIIGFAIFTLCVFALATFMVWVGRKVEARVAWKTTNSDDLKIGDDAGSAGLGPLVIRIYGIDYSDEDDYYEFVLRNRKDKFFIPGFHTGNEVDFIRKRGVTWDVKVVANQHVLLARQR